jgi:twitching motility protein PilT
MRAIMREICSSKQWAQFEEEHDLDFAYTSPGVGRVRSSYFQQEGGAGAVFRLIPEKVISLSLLPPAVAALADLEQGLVIITGPTGSGKTTTITAVLDKINQTYAKHIVTIEDPIEFVHQNKKSTVSQREVGTHSEDSQSALRAAIRQDAGVILVGEMRDLETMQLAITAAEMGMLVFATLHTNNAAKTIDRIIDSFPPDQQTHVRAMLADSLAAVVSQMLIPRTDGKGLVAAFEVLLRTPALANVVREGNTSLVSSIIQGGRALGMVSLDDTLYQLAKDAKIKGEDAYLKATTKSRFEEFTTPGVELGIRVA